MRRFVASPVHLMTSIQSHQPVNLINRCGLHSPVDALGGALDGRPVERNYRYVHFQYLTTCAVSLETRAAETLYLVLQQSARTKVIYAFVYSTQSTENMDKLPTLASQLLSCYNVHRCPEISALFFLLQ